MEAPRAHAASMAFHPRPPAGSLDPAPAVDSSPVAVDAVAWAQTVWADREAWINSRGGVESVFTAAQVLGCREEAVRWLKTRTRI